MAVRGPCLGPILPLQFQVYIYVRVVRQFTTPQGAGAVYAFRTYIVYLLNIPIIICLKVNTYSHVRYSKLCKCLGQPHWVRVYV